MITVIGYDGGPLAADARAALDEATLVVGGVRHLDAVGVPDGAERVVLGELEAALVAIGAHLGGAGPAAAPREGGGEAAKGSARDGAVAAGREVGEGAAACGDAAAGRSVCVVASGDPGFFGIVRILRERGFELRVVPVASSIATAFAHLGLPWDDAIVVTAHGRDLRPAVNVCRAFPKVAVLTGPGAGARELGAALPDRTFVVAQRLGEADQRVEIMSSLAAAHGRFAEPHVVICLDESRLASRRGWMSGFTGVPGAWAEAESAFEHRDSMITKSEVRAVALARLAPRPGTLIWDVGAGSGSVGIECARFGAAVVAVERDRESCERIRANAAAFDVAVEVVAADALAALDRLPTPDAVFVGGGGVDVIAACAESPARTVVVALAAIERVPETIRLLTKSGRAADGVLLQASRLSVLPGDHHRFAAANPVFLLWGERP